MGAERLMPEMWGTAPASASKACLVTHVHHHHHCLGCSNGRWHVPEQPRAAARSHLAKQTMQQLQALLLDPIQVGWLNWGSWLARALLILHGAA